VKETRVLLANIDEPDLNTIDVYERLGGYKAMRKALLEMDPAGVLHELEESGLRGRGGAGFAMGKKARTSTCAATPTSPSRARSRTGS
jgi:NADH-quinone oxidoreductase subunit F